MKFVARIYGQNSQSIIKYVNEFSELGKSMKLFIKTYSSGMRARLSFGLSLAIVEYRDSIYKLLAAVKIRFALNIFV